MTELAVNCLAGAAMLILVAGVAPAVAEDDFPIVGAWTENAACVGADASVQRVKITPRDIESSGIVTLTNDRRAKSCTQSRSCRSGDFAPCLHGRGSECPVRLC